MNFIILKEHIGYDDNNRVKKEINKQFPFSRIEKTEVHLKETGNNHLRYLSNSRSLGMIRLVSGMTFANNPLNMMASLSNIVAIAFTTGAFGLIFQPCGIWVLIFLYGDYLEFPSWQF